MIHHALRWEMLALQNVIYDYVTEKLPSATKIFTSRQKPRPESRPASLTDLSPCLLLMSALTLSRTEERGSSLLALLRASVDSTTTTSQSTTLCCRSWASHACSDSRVLDLYVSMSCPEGMEECECVMCSS